MNKRHIIVYNKQGNPFKVIRRTVITLNCNNLFFANLVRYNNKHYYIDREQHGDFLTIHI